MTLYRHRGETQRALVERTLREAGSISAHEATFNLRYDDGTTCAITRMASVIGDLRNAGWVIDTDEAPDRQAIYRLRTQPSAEPEWRCQTCRSLPATEPIPLLGGLGQAHCANCGVKRYFKRAA